MTDNPLHSFACDSQEGGKCNCLGIRKYRISTMKNPDGYIVEANSYSDAEGQIRMLEGGSVFVKAVSFLTDK